MGTRLHWVGIALIFAAIPVTSPAGVFFNNPPSHDVDPRAAMTQAWLVRVKPGGKAVLYENDDVVKAHCPALTPACRTKAYLIPGDVAVAAYTVG